MTDTVMHIHPQVVKLAAAALVAATNRDNDEVVRIIETIDDAYGPEGITGALGCWCDMLIAHTGGSKPGESLRLEFEAVEDGEISDADAVDAATAWAGRLFVARRAADRDQWIALLSAMPTDPDERGDFMVTLLFCVAETIREALHRHDALRKNWHLN